MPILRCAVSFFIFSVFSWGMSLGATPHLSASSSQEASFLPENACDGDFKTRWSSAFSDPEWLQIDLGEATEVSGLTLFWEEAYGKAYDILLSGNGQDWEKVFTTSEGDGKTDDIFFRKRPARYIKIFCKERGTFWGYSLWEVSVKKAEEEVILEASSSMKGAEAFKAMDGDQRTMWKSEASAKAWLKLNLRQEKAFGGIQLDWGEDFPRSYRIFISSDGKNGSKIYSTRRGNGGKDCLPLDLKKGQWIKIICHKSSTGKGFSLKEISLMGADEIVTPQRRYELLAEEAPRGYFPKWLSRQQAYWTVVGVVDDEEESLLCEDGSIEPSSKSFSLMPYLYMKGEFITSENAQTTQSLEDEYLPIPSVGWRYRGLVFDQKIFAAGESGHSATYVEYTLENTTDQALDGKLYLTIRPFQVNPPWQYGGLSMIHRLEYQEKPFACVWVNGHEAVFPLEELFHFGAVSSKKGDIIFKIEKGRLPKDQKIEDTEGYASGALAYDFNLKAHSKQKFFFVIPLHDIDVMLFPSQSQKAEDFFEEKLESIKKDWANRLNKIRIDAPNTRLVQVMKSNLAYLLINNDTPRFQPGSRNYQKAWMRDGGAIAGALLRMGFTEEVKIFLDWMALGQRSDGQIPFMMDATGLLDWARDWKEYDSQGEFIHGVWEYYLFTKDKKFLEEKFPAVEKALKFLANIRNERLTEEFKTESKKIFYGILPQSNSHEGYFPAQHSYWDDFWALRGWKDAQAMAQVLGQSDEVEWIKTEQDHFRKDVWDSIALVIKQQGLSCIPGCAEKGDFDPSATAMVLFPCEEYESSPLQGMIQSTFERYDRETFLPRLKSDWKGTLSPYEIRIASAFIFLGEKEKSLKLLTYFLTLMRPGSWNHWAEVVFSTYRHPQYIGDMPHTWIGAEYIYAVRNLFVYEKNDQLILGAGIPKGWVMDQGVTVENLPTYYGKVSYTLRYDDQGLKLKVWGEARPPQGFILKSPFSNHEWEFSKLPQELVLQEESS